MREVFGFVKENHPERSEGGDRERRKGCGERGGSPLPRLIAQGPRRASARRLGGAFLAHGVAPQFKSVRIVDEPIEDAVGGGGIANLFVAFNFSTDDWVNFKLFGATGLMLAFVLAQGLLLQKYIEEKE